MQDTLVNIHRLSFLEQFEVYSQSEKGLRVPVRPTALTHSASRYHPPTRVVGPFVTTDEPTLIRPCHPKYVADPRVFGVGHSVGVDGCGMTWAHLSDIIQGIFTALKVLGALPLRPSPATPGHP